MKLVQNRDGSKAGLTDQLRELIAQGSWAPGAALRQEELASRFGVSRIPVRDALHALQAEGLVVIDPNRGTFVERGQFVLVMKVLIPTIVFVGLIWLIGIYFAAAIFIAFFMYWLGKYPIQKILPVAILIPLALFVMFEIWFLVPLPKGPVEAMLGY